MMLHTVQVQVWSIFVGSTILEDSHRRRFRIPEGKPYVTTLDQYESAGEWEARVNRLPCTKQARIATTWRVAASPKLAPSMQCWWPGISKKKLNLGRSGVPEPLLHTEYPGMLVHAVGCQRSAGLGRGNAGGMPLLHDGDALTAIAQPTQLESVLSAEGLQCLPEHLARWEPQI